MALNLNDLLGAGWQSRAGDTYSYGASESGGAEPLFTGTFAVPVGNVLGDGKNYFLQKQPNGSGYVLWTDHGTVNKAFDSNGNYTHDYRGNEAFGAKDLLAGAATVGLGMGLGSLLTPALASAGAAGAGAGVNLGTATGADLSTFYDAIGAPAGSGLGGGASVAGGAALAGAGAAPAAAAGGATNALSAFLPSGGYSSLIGPAASLASGYLSSKAAGDAADTQSQAARDAAALQEPFRQGGVSALQRELDLLGLSDNTGAQGYGSAAKDFSMADFQADPGYAFRLKQGQDALESSAAARGNLLSGKTIKDTLDYSQGLASQEYGNAYNRFQTNRAAKLQPLQSLRGMGMSSANTVGEYGLQGANAQAAGTVGSANAVSNALSQGLGYMQSQDMMDYLRSRANSPLYRSY